jgi:TRAP-type C4-dicarboxylate transport system, periplasmic component
VIIWAEQLQMRKKFNNRRKRFVSVLTAVLVFLLASAAGLEAKQQGSHKEMTLTIASYIPVGYPYLYAGQKRFIDIVNERGKGIVQLNAYFGGTLLKGKLLLPGLQAGTTDLIFQTGSYLLGAYPIIGIQVLPVWGNVAKSYEALKIDTPLAKLQNNELKKKNLFQLAASGGIPEFLWTRKKLVKTPEDMKGLKIRVAGKVEAKIIQAMGASPVTLPSADIPQALQRGVIDGVLMNPWTAQGRGIEEFCKHMLVYPMSHVNTPVYVLWNKWNGWPEDVRKTLMSAAIEWESGYIGPPGSMVNDDQLLSELIPFYEKKGMKPLYLTEEEAMVFDKAIKPVIDWWVDRVGEDAGMTALRHANR